MCWFLYVGFPAERADAGRRRLELGDVNAWETDDRAVLRAFPSNDRVFFVLTSICSCDLWGFGRGVHDAEKKRAKYRRRGWSANKVQRAMEAWRKTQQIGERAPFERTLARAADDAGELRFVAVWAGKEAALPRWEEASESVVCSRLLELGAVRPKDGRVHTVRDGSDVSTSLCWYVLNHRTGAARNTTETIARHLATFPDGPAGAGHRRIVVKHYERTAEQREIAAAHAMLADGVDTYWHREVERALRGNPDLHGLPRCGDCGRLLRTPRARQCLACGADWH